MNLKRLSAVILSIICSVFLLIQTCFADFGNFDTYDSGWDSGWDSSSDWDSDWSSDGGYIFFSDPHSASDSDTDTDIGALLIVIIIIAIIVILQYKRSKNVGTQANRRSYRAPSQRYSGTYQNKNAEIGTLIREYDEFFNTDKFLSFANEAYVKLQSAWSSRSTEQIRLLLSEELYAQTAQQVEEYKVLGRINVMERIAVQESYLTSYSSDNEKETLAVYLYATQKDYIIDENTKNIIEGSDSQYRHSKYILTFIRAKGKKTETGDGIEATNCPNCGAPLEITASGKCAYCDSIITNEDHSWVISSIKRVH